MPVLEGFSYDEADAVAFGLGGGGGDGDERRRTPRYLRRVWNAYHERQIRAEEERQYSRPVCVDPLLWGDLLGRKLRELIEKERAHPRSFAMGGVADRKGDRCLLPGKHGAVLLSFSKNVLSVLPRLLRLCELCAFVLLWLYRYRLRSHTPSRPVLATLYDSALRIKLLLFSLLHVCCV